MYLRSVAEGVSAQPTTSMFVYQALGNRAQSVSTNRYADFVPRAPCRNVQTDCSVKTGARQVAHPFGAIVRLLMLTGQRREEVAGMTWAELSEDLATWTIPATRTKNGVPHLVPLSEPARKLLHALSSDGPGDVQGAHQHAKLALADLAFDQPLKGVPRSLGKNQIPVFPGGGCMTCAGPSRGLQRLGVRLEVTEAVLNHLSGSRAGVVGIYQRHDWAQEKRAALDAWSAHLLAAAEGRLPAGKVLPFSRAGSGEI